MKKASGNQLVGIEIGDDQIRLAVATPTGTGYVVRCYRRALPPGAEESGYVVQSDAVSGALRELLAATGVRPRRASLVIGGKRTVCCVEPVAPGEESDAEAVADDRMRRYVVFAGRPMIISHALQESQAHGAHPRWLVSAATPRELVVRQVQVAQRCGLTVLRVEPKLVAVARMLLAQDTPAPPRLVLLALDDGCEAATIRQDGLVFCHHINLGVEALASDGHRLLATLDRITDYHLRHAHGTGPIQELLCCGPTDAFDGLSGCLNDTGIRSGWLDPSEFPGVELLEGNGMETPAERAAMAPAVAEALAEGMRASSLGPVDLLPPPEKKRPLRLLTRWTVVPAILTLLATVGFTTHAWLTRRQVAELMHRISHPTPEMQECRRLQLRESRLKERCAEAALLLASVRTHASASFVAELPRLLPKDVWLERLTVQGSSHCVIQGKAQSADTVFSFSELLRKSPHVESVTIAGTDVDRAAGVILSGFRLDVTLAPLDRAPGEETRK